MLNSSNMPKKSSINALVFIKNFIILIISQKSLTVNNIDVIMNI